VSEVFINVESSAAYLYETKLSAGFPRGRTFGIAGEPSCAPPGGVLPGLLPGFSPAVTTFLAYDLERRVPRTRRDSARAPSRRGRRRGANNAASSGSFVPLFAFGIPSCAPIAVLMGPS
jgi:putative tricarboxylic transport membrane protein